MGFDIFGLHVAYYGIIIASGLLVGVLLCDFLCRKRGYDNNIPYLLVLVIVPLAILGARLYYIIFSDQLTLANFFDMTNGGFQGLAIYGAEIGGMLGVIIYCRMKKCSIFPLLDLIVPALILGQCIGRWGNYFNQEAYGIATNLTFFPFAVYIDALQEYHLATFFYESFMNFIGFWVILLVYFKQKKHGTSTATYLIWYGIVRAMIEPLRTDSLLIPGTTADFVFNRISFVISIALIGVGVLLLLLNIKGKLSQNDKQLFKQSNQ
ncbi:MAG: prolipoprotein diacylglyceryl transferase [Clostridia bacterium]|nr:prolipoprotein diacylglyceryl transferase [Clostridia bacterium]